MCANPSHLPSSELNLHVHFMCVCTCIKRSGSSRRAQEAPEPLVPLQLSGSTGQKKGMVYGSQRHL